MKWMLRSLIIIAFALCVAQAYGIEGVEIVPDVVYGHKHGDKDELVPLEHSENILAEFKKHKVTSELLVIKGAGHGFRGEDGELAADSLVAWFEKHLLKK